MNIKESIESVRKSFRTDSDPLPTDSKDLELLHIKYLGRKGLVADLFSQLKDVSNKAVSYTHLTLPTNREV